MISFLPHLYCGLYCVIYLPQKGCALWLAFYIFFSIVFGASAAVMILICIFKMYGRISTLPHFWFALTFCHLRRFYP